jgi:hypothetical protein
MRCPTVASPTPPREPSGTVALSNRQLLRAEAVRSQRPGPVVYELHVYYPGDRIVLAPVLDDGLEAADEAVREALDAGVSSDELILSILARRREPPRSAGIITSEALKLRHPPIADCARYDRLRGSRAAA